MSGDAEKSLADVRACVCVCGREKFPKIPEIWVFQVPSSRRLFYYASRGVSNLGATNYLQV
jgi:hypothetical protein